MSICFVSLGVAACDVNVNVNGGSGSTGGIDSVSPSDTESDDEGGSEEGSEDDSSDVDTDTDSSDTDTDTDSSDVDTDTDSSDTDTDTDSSDIDTDTDSSDTDTDTDSSGDVTEYETITIAEAIELCGEPGNITTERYCIRAIVKSVTNPQYGAMIIQDETGEIAVYGTYSADGSIGYAAMEEKPYKGDEVLLSCILQNYNGTPEVKNARLIEFTSNQGKVDESAYTDMTIAEAREAQEGDYVKVDGAVAQITYANGMKPSGVYLVDDTQSIYVYDADLAGRVQVGNIVTILAEKDYWILEKEESAAAKHGYNGCNQLTNVTVVSISNEDVSYNMDWVTETTVKEIMDTPLTEDITTTIYKVNALVEERPGEGFTNYYFFDIDGETGSYTYTQCNGGDFEWVRAYHGKICTVLLSVINYKSTDSACVARFLPIAIYDEGYVFDTAKAGEYAVKYHALDQFESVYNADPEKEMVTSVSSELLGFENATVSYASSNTDVVYFEEVEGKTIMHCVANGNATITITGTYNEKSYEATVDVVFIDPESIDYITVAEAIEVAPNQPDVGSVVTVRGIVGPSIVNKEGFYLFGEDGSMIAVLVNDTKEFAGLEIGHEVILTGERERYIKDDANAVAGQTCIVKAVIDVNLYGKHEYSTAKFEQLSAEEFYALDGKVDYSTKVYVVTATVVQEGNGYYTNLKLDVGNGNKISLYCSSAGQYSWLQDFVGQEVTLELAPCNWNDKGYWASCALAVYTEDGKILNTLYFDTF